MKTNRRKSGVPWFGIIGFLITTGVLVYINKNEEPVTAIDAISRSKEGLKRALEKEVSEAIKELQSRITYASGEGWVSTSLVVNRQAVREQVRTHFLGLGYKVSIGEVCGSYTCDTYIFIDWSYE